MTLHDNKTAFTLVSGIEVMPANDQIAIGRTLRALLAGFACRDVSVLEGIYSDDADWVNAFGTVKWGSAQILDYLHGLFADAGFKAGQVAAPPESRLRKLTDTVVSVSTYLQVKGQGLSEGGQIPVRDNYSLRILQKQGDGRWLIVSEIYMDARQDTTYRRAEQ
jgi:ketosteroid isomerase-like protein